MVSLVAKSYKLNAVINNRIWRSLSSLKESYVYHPKQETLEADVQALLWTKTQSLQHCPPSFTKVKNELELDKFITPINFSILSSRVYEMKEVKMKYKNKPKDLTNGSHKHFPPSFLLNTFKMALTHTTSYPHLSNLNLLLEPFIAASWPCEDDKLTARGKVDMLLTNKRPLKQFYDGDIVKESADFDFKSLENVLKFGDLKKYKVKNVFSSSSTERISPYPHAHTLIVLDNGDYIKPPSKAVPEVQLLQKGLVFTFGRLCAQAVSKYGESIMGQDLPEPECAQCIVTNGHTFSFLWYQLNTLKTNNLNEGVKNLAFINRAGMLYSSVESESLFRKKVVDINNDILQTLVAMIMM